MVSAVTALCTLAPHVGPWSPAPVISGPGVSGGSLLWVLNPAFFLVVEAWRHLSLCVHQSSSLPTPPYPATPTLLMPKGRLENGHSHPILVLGVLSSFSLLPQTQIGAGQGPGCAVACRVQVR